MFIKITTLWQDKNMYIVVTVIITIVIIIIIIIITRPLRL